jgi:cell wall-associated NlpC family hydrolase
MEAYDPRVTPARPDLAARHLEGRVEASQFVEGQVRVVLDPQAPLRREPAPDAALATEALKGERVTVYEATDEGWCWGQLENDGYVGWLPANALAAPGPPPTHRVAVPRTLAFPGASIRLPPVEFLSLGCRLHILRHEREFAVSPGGYLPARHVVPLGAEDPDFVAVAERFLDVPYLWGGKTSLGIDCSGLVQVALAAAGVPCPRDSDMQEQALGEAIDPGHDGANLRRGDLLFWPGHVAIARDAATLLHANAFHMAVAIEPVFESVARIAAAGIGLRCVKRLGAG